MKRLVMLIMLVAVLFSSALVLDAREEYARRTAKSCTFCHAAEMGGPLKDAGIAYMRGGYHYPIAPSVLSKVSALSTPGIQTIRFLIGYLHLLAAVILVGAIFYIHIFVGPKQLTTGIPKGERILGLSCLSTLLITGIFLTWFRIDHWGQFFDNFFGRVLFIKILLFALLLGIALIAVTIVHSRLRRSAAAPQTADPAALTLESVAVRKGGADGTSAWIVFENAVFDVSESPKWKNGRHFGKHSAGADLTEAMASAPHGAEMLERVKRVGELQQSKPQERPVRQVHRVFVVMAYTNMVLILGILCCVGLWRWGFSTKSSMASASPQAVAGQSCVDCHRTRNPGLVEDWEHSVHAKLGVGCLKCHQAGENRSAYVAKAHLVQSQAPIEAVVSPQTCGQCHPRQAQEFSGSKHAHTIEIMWKIDAWLNQGLNNDIERESGCYVCHGTVVTLVNGKPMDGTWPNVGIGRINPDGSKGSCSSCHTRHRFSVAEARKPDACGQCHLGPDHPQAEIYAESKHGGIFKTEGNRWNWTPDDGHWMAGRDYRAPTCAACHISPAPGVASSHDVTQRLSWETQAPLTVRPSDFKPFPAQTDWQAERRKMETVCMQCHSEQWTREHFTRFDRVVSLYNETYFLPAQTVMRYLYERGLLTESVMFDEPIEWEYYELWHHEGRRARMGTAMMAPDYAWWHGFYELKHRYAALTKEARTIAETGHSPRYDVFPGKMESDVPKP
ncbi:multiheme c-type cytochrome [Desulfatirhabdium butyrativorans]|uniref:multiheme c-type cytochrome n=1 Tax=Desulfatirhabdium butyrativorans TaxID=340467 RepID=UPI00041EE70F|nr:multiheme c-type cytochrome [Desulfatirhabdium butyrativorans]